MKRILFFVANSVFFLLLVLSIRSTPAYADTCSSGSCTQADICNSANGLQRTSGTCTGVDAGLVCCAAIPNPTPVTTCSSGVCTLIGNCGGQLGGSCSLAGGEGVCCIPVAPPTNTPTPVPTATRVPTTAPTATRVPTPTACSNANPSGLCPTGESCIYGTGGFFQCSGPTLTATPTPIGCTTSSSCPNGGTCNISTHTCSWPACDTAGGYSCHNPNANGAYNCGAGCDALGSECCLIPTATPTPDTTCGPNYGTCSSLGDMCYPESSTGPYSCQPINCGTTQHCTSDQTCSPLGFVCIPTPTPTPAPNSCITIAGQFCSTEACNVSGGTVFGTGSCTTPGDFCCQSAFVTPPTSTPTPTPTLTCQQLCTQNGALNETCLQGCQGTLPTNTPTTTNTPTPTPIGCTTSSSCPNGGTCNTSTHTCSWPACNTAGGYSCHNPINCQAGTAGAFCDANGSQCCIPITATPIPSPTSTPPPAGKTCNTDNAAGVCYLGSTCPGGTENVPDINNVCGTTTICCTAIPTPTNTIAPTATSIPGAPTATDTIVPTTGPGTPTYTPVPTQVPVVSFTPEIQEGSAICTAPGTALHVTVASQNGGGTGYSFTASLPNNDGTATGAVDGGFQTLTLPDSSNPDAVFYETNSQITINFTVTLSDAVVYTGSATINNTCQQSLTGTPTDTPIISPSLTPTGTLTPTVTPTATPTTSPLTSTQFNLNVHLHDIGDTGDNVSTLSSLSNKNPVDKTITVTVGALGDSSIPNNTFSAAGKLFFNGNSYTTTNPATNQTEPIVFSPQLPNGSYAFKIISPKYLAKQIPNIIAINGPGTYTLPDVSLTAGDVNLDNQLTINDYTTILSCINNKTSCDATIHSRADTNDDGAVDATDENLFLRELSVQAGQ